MVVPALSQMVVPLFLGLFLLRWSVEIGLTGLNLTHLLSTPPVVPQPLIGKLDQSTVDSSREYTVVRLRFALARNTVGSVAVLAVLFSGVLPRLEAELVGMGLAGSHLFTVFLASLAVAWAVASLPFGLFNTFAIEARFGFNRTTPVMWMADRLKSVLLAALLGLPFLFAVYFFMERTGPSWWVWLFGFITVGQMVLVWLYPTLIAPWFNKFTPLAEGELRGRLEDLAQKAGFRTGGILVMDASRRSGHSNAYFTGLFRPRIVLFDTLLQEMSLEETLAVLAHEIGHFKMRHVRHSLLLGLVWSFGMLYVLSLLVNWQPLFDAFGFSAPSHHVALALAMLIGGAFTFYMEPLMAWLSRRREYAADAYSVKLLHLAAPLKSALVRLNRQNLANLHPHPLYSGYHYSHPTLLERLAAIDRLAARMAKAGTAAD